METNLTTDDTPAPDTVALNRAELTSWLDRTRASICEVHGSNDDEHDCLSEMLDIVAEAVSASDNPHQYHWEGDEESSDA